MYSNSCCATESNNSKWANHFCSVSNDNTVSVFNIDDFRCLHTLSGHRFPIKSLLWRHDDGNFLVECDDGAVYVWQLGKYIYQVNIYIYMHSLSRVEVRVGIGIGIEFGPPVNSLLLW